MFRRNGLRFMKIIGTIILLLSIVGEVKCVYKMFTCNWDPVGKAEAIYTIGTFTGFGCVIGYIDIKDK